MTNDPLSPSMPGPAIRAWQLSRVLAGTHKVKLASTVACERRSADFDCLLAEPGKRRRLERWADVIVTTAGSFHDWPGIARSDAAVVVDLYDPYHLENLEPGVDEPSDDRESRFARMTAGIGDHLARGDFFMCATERQRDFWIGSLVAAGRVTPRTYDDDPTFGALIGVVPFGIPAEPPQRSGPGLRDSVPGIGPADRVVLWAGGVYNWFDPVTLVRAVGSLARTRGDVRLVFMGMGHPNPAIPAMRAAAEARSASDRLGLTGQHVFFNEGWVPYEQRSGFLLDADLGVSTHLDHIETRYSFRTRVLDYIWAGLPMVLTEGDTLTETVVANGLGAAVPPRDADALAAAIDSVLAAGKPPSERFDALRGQLSWERVAEPLVAFCERPRRAPDAVPPGHRPAARMPSADGVANYTPAMASPSSGLRKARERAFGALMRQIANEAAAESYERISGRIAEVERILGDQGDASDEVAETFGRMLTKLSAEIASLNAEVVSLNAEVARLNGTLGRTDAPT